jgi:hypothetical protein
MSLNWYLNDTSSLLHDLAFTFTSQQQLVRWINEARRQAAQRSACVRRLVSGQSAFGASAQPGSAIPGGVQPGALPGSNPGAIFNATTNAFMTIPGVERYPYQGFVNPFLTSQYAGIAGVIDTITCAVCWGGSNGSPRPALAFIPWEELQAYARAYATLVTSYPYWWSVYNDGEAGELWLFPVPSFAMEMELDVFCMPSDLNTDSDYDAIPDGFKNAIKFGAASLAFQSTFRYGQAQLMENRFADRLGVARVAVDMGKVSNYYIQGI